MNIIIITGASSGIGQEFALQIDTAFSNIDEIWLIARREERLQEVAHVMEHTTRILPLDITKRKDIKELQKALSAENITIRMLINCAGYGLMGAFSDLNLKEQLGMLQINCTALTEMTYLCLPYMKKNSRIIQLASSAAFLPQQDFAVYAATKSYVLSFSRALSEELRSRHIYVTAVCPGPVNTEFFDIAEQYGTTLAIKKITMVTAEKVVTTALRDSYHKHQVSVCSLPIKLFHTAGKLLPHEWMLACARILKEHQH